MAGQELCLRNKFGFCKFNQLCKFRHNNEKCDTRNCDEKKCEKRHPRECWWYNKYNRCKFAYCAYSHKEKNDFKSKIEELERKIDQKNNEINAQIKKISEIESRLKESDLEERVKQLEKFVLVLQEEIEMKEKNDHELGSWNPEKSGWAILDPLVRRPSLEIKCDQCDYVGRNSARLKAHMEVKHKHICRDCFWGKEFETKERLKEHQTMVHENQEQVLTNEEFENLNENDLKQIKDYGGDTPRSRDIRKKYNLRQKQLNL